jgi:hypothetical protein
MWSEEILVTYLGPEVKEMIREVKLFLAFSKAQVL